MQMLLELTLAQMKTYADSLAGIPGAALTRRHLLEWVEMMEYQVRTEVELMAREEATRLREQAGACETIGQGC